MARRQLFSGTAVIALLLLTQFAPIPVSGTSHGDGLPASEQPPMVEMMRDLGFELSEIGVEVPPNTADRSAPVVVRADFEDGGAGDPPFDSGATFFFKVVSGIFADGFETGNTLRWSAQQPPATPTPTPTRTATPTPTKTPYAGVEIECSLVTVTGLQAWGNDEFTATITNGLVPAGSEIPFLKITRTVWTWHPSSPSHFVDYFSVNVSPSYPMERYWHGDGYVSPVDIETAFWNPPNLNMHSGGTAPWFADLSPDLPRPAGAYEVCLDFDIEDAGSKLGECLDVCASLVYAGDSTPTPTPSATSTPTKTATTTRTPDP